MLLRTGDLNFSTIGGTVQEFSGILILKEQIPFVLQYVRVDEQIHQPGTMTTLSLSPLDLYLA